MIDLQACREAYSERSIDNIGWVQSKNNAADDLTKVDKAELIQQIMHDGTLSTVADQWIVRPEDKGAISN